MMAARLGGDEPDPVANMKIQFSIELRDMLTDHHNELHQRIVDWMSRHDSSLEAFGRPDTDADGAAQNFKTTVPPRAAYDRSSLATLDTVRPSNAGATLSRGFSSTWKSELRHARLYTYVQRSRMLDTPAEDEPRSPCLMLYATRLRSLARALVHSKVCDYFFSCVILCYVLATGLEVELDSELREYPLTIQAACNVIFIVELVLRMYAMGLEFFQGKDLPWNLFDFGLVFISLAEMAIVRINYGLKNKYDNVLMLRVVRVIRIVRVARVLRLLRFFRHLRMLIHSIFATLKSLVWAVLLLGVIMYSFGVVFTQAAKEHEVEAGPTQLSYYYGSVMRSILTLFKSVTNGVSWELVFQPLHDEHWMYGCIFILYIIFATFAVLNVMTGQFCQAAMESAKKNDDDMICDLLANKEMYVTKLKSLFASLTEDAENRITLDTFEKSINNERIQAYFHSLDIKISDAWTLFRLLDEHNENAIDMTKFIEGCLQLRGPATAIDIKKLAHEIHWFDKHLGGHLEEVACNQKKIIKWFGPPSRSHECYADKAKL